MRTRLTEENTQAVAQIRERIAEALRATRDGEHLAELSVSLMATVQEQTAAAIAARGFRVHGVGGKAKAKAGAAA